VQNDPTAPDYDAVALQRIGIEVNAIFKTEPRNEGWAPEMESKLKAQIEKDVLTMAPGTLSTEIECRTAVCRVAIDVPSAERKAALAALQIGLFGTRSTFTSEGVGNSLVIYASFDQKLRDPGKYEQTYLKARAAALQKLRTKPPEERPGTFKGLTLPEI
jgi:hypothetical protein